MSLTRMSRQAIYGIGSVWREIYVRAVNNHLSRRGQVLSPRPLVAADVRDRAMLYFNARRLFRQRPAAKWSTPKPAGRKRIAMEKRRAKQHVASAARNARRPARRVEKGNNLAAVTF